MSASRPCSLKRHTPQMNTTVVSCALDMADGRCACYRFTAGFLQQRLYVWTFFLWFFLRSSPSILPRLPGLADLDELVQTVLGFTPFSEGLALSYHPRSR